MEFQKNRNSIPMSTNISENSTTESINSTNTPEKPPDKTPGEKVVTGLHVDDKYGMRIRKSFGSRSFWGTVIGNYKINGALFYKISFDDGDVDILSSDETNQDNKEALKYAREDPQKKTNKTSESSSNNEKDKLSYRDATRSIRKQVGTMQIGAKRKRTEVAEDSEIRVKLWGSRLYASIIAINGHIYINEFMKTAIGEIGEMEHTGKVKIGDRLDYVSKSPVVGLSSSQVSKLIQTSPRPVTLTFSRHAVPTVNNENQNSSELAERNRSNSGMSSRNNNVQTSQLNNNELNPPSQGGLTRIVGGKGKTLSTAAILNKHSRPPTQSSHTTAKVPGALPRNVLTSTTQRVGNYLPQSARNINYYTQAPKQYSNTLINLSNAHNLQTTVNNRSIPQLQQTMSVSVPPSAHYLNQHNSATRINSLGLRPPHPPATQPVVNLPQHSMLKNAQHEKRSSNIGINVTNPQYPANSNTLSSPINATIPQGGQIKPSLNSTDEPGSKNTQQHTVASKQTNKNSSSHPTANLSRNRNGTASTGELPGPTTVQNPSGKGNSRSRTSASNAEMNVPNNSKSTGQNLSESLPTENIVSTVGEVSGTGENGVVRSETPTNQENNNTSKKSPKDTPLEANKTSFLSLPNKNAATKDNEENQSVTPLDFNMGDENEYITVTITKHRLYITLGTSRGKMIVSSFVPDENGACGELELSGKVLVGDVLVAINGSRLHPRWQPKDVARVITQYPRPVQLYFQRPSWDSLN